MPSPTLPTTRPGLRTLENRENDRPLTMNEMLNRVLNNSGGDRTNYIFVTSMVILFIFIAVMANTEKGMDNATSLGLGVLDLGTLGMSTKAKAPEIHRQKQPIPTDVNIVIVGDSVARYGYLSLVYFLRWGRWFDPGLEASNLVNEHSFDNPFHNNTYSEFYFQTSRMLQPYELCDCHKGAAHPNMRKYVIENRYYHDPVNRNSVTFFHSYGSERPVQGRLDAENVYTTKWHWDTKEDGLLNAGWSRPTWRHETWNDLFQNYIAKLNPKPQFAVLNSGEWNSNYGSDKGEMVSKMLESRIRKLDIRPIWRTTTYDEKHEILKGSAGTSEGTLSTDSYMCALFGNCLNVSWTKELDPNNFWDDRHYFEPVYRVMNEQLLDQMGYLDEDYVKYDVSQLLLKKELTVEDVP
jgi:hypothetical protein